LQLAGGFFGEGDGDDFDHLRAPRREHAQDPVDQLRRLAGAGGGLDDERRVEIVFDRLPGVGVVAYHACHHFLLSRGAPRADALAPWRSGVSRTERRSGGRKATGAIASTAVRSDRRSCPLASLPRALLRAGPTPGGNRTTATPVLRPRRPGSPARPRVRY